VSGDESRREKDSLENESNGLSFSSHDVGMEDSISPGEGRRIPVLGSLVAALALSGVVETSEVNNEAEVMLLRNLRRSRKISRVLISLLLYGELKSS